MMGRQDCVQRQLFYEFDLDSFRMNCEVECNRAGGCFSNVRESDQFDCRMSFSTLSATRPRHSSIFTGSLDRGGLGR